MDRFTLVSFAFVLFALPACGGGGGAPPVAGQVVAVDTVPPATAADPVGGDYDEILEVVLSASEEAKVFVSINGGDFTDAGPSPVRLAMPEADTTIEFYSVDAAGNTEIDVRHERYRVDLTPPELTLANRAPDPIPWLSSIDVTWTTDEACHYTVRVVETDALLQEGELDAGATASLQHDAKGLPDEPITVRIEATDWIGRTSTLEYTLERAAPLIVSLDYWPGDVVVTPTGDRAFVANRHASEVDVVDLATGEVVETIDVGIRAWELSLHPSGKLIYVANTLGPGAIATIDVDSYDVERLTADVGVPGPVAFSGDGALGYCTDFAGNVVVLDTDPASASYHQVLDVVFVDRDLLSGEIAASQEGEFLLLSWNRFEATGLTRVDFDGGVPTVTTVWRSNIEEGSNLSASIVLSGDGQRAYVSSLALICGLCSYEMEEVRLVQAGEDTDGVVDAPADFALIDADTSLLSISTNGKFVRLYAADSMQHRSRFEIGSGGRALAVTSDGTTAVVSRSISGTDELVILPLR